MKEPQGFDGAQTPWLQCKPWAWKLPLHDTGAAGTGLQARLH